MTRDRGRLTLTDVVTILFGLAGLAALYPVYSMFLADLAPRIPEGVELIFGSVLPFLIVVLLGVIYAESRGGIGR